MNRNGGFELDSVENDKALSIQFSEAGYNSTQFLKNSGSSLLYLILYIFAWITLLSMSFLSRFSPRINTMKEKLKSKLVWNWSITFLMSQLPPLMLCSMINVFDLRFASDSKGTAYSAYISIVVLVTLILALFLIFLKISRLKKS